MKAAANCPRGRAVPQTVPNAQGSDSAHWGGRPPAHPGPGCGRARQPMSGHEAEGSGRGARRLSLEFRAGKTRAGAMPCTPSNCVTRRGRAECRTNSLRYRRSCGLPPPGRARGVASRSRVKTPCPGTGRACVTIAPQSCPCKPYAHPSRCRAACSAGCPARRRQLLPGGWRVRSQPAATVHRRGRYSGREDQAPGPTG